MQVKVKHHLPGPPYQEWNADAELHNMGNTVDLVVKNLHDGGYLKIELSTEELKRALK